MMRVFVMIGVFWLVFGSGVVVGVLATRKRDLPTPVPPPIPFQRRSRVGKAA